MRTFILVHGTWGGGWQWRDVADRLRAKGNTVFTPTLTGLGEREHLISRDANLEMHINDIAAVIRYEKLETVVLVGTSYAGLVISGVADRLSHRITTLIYLNAALPVNGKSMLDTLPEERRNTVKKLAEVEGDGYRVPTSLVLDTGIEDNDRRDDFLRRMTPHPLESLLQPIHLCGKFEQVPRKAYVLATKKISHHFREHYDWAKNTNGWTAHEMPTYHYPMATAPEATSELLMEIAQ